MIAVDLGAMLAPRPDVDAGRRKAARVTRSALTLAYYTARADRDRAAVTIGLFLLDGFDVTKRLERFRRLTLATDDRFAALADFEDSQDPS